MNTEIVLGVLKVGGAIVSGALGLTAIFSDYRGLNGKLNLNGKIVLAGIVSSLIVSTSISTLETINNHYDTQDQLRRNERLLIEINRSTQLITQMEVFIFFSLDDGQASLDHYKNRIKNKISDRLLDLANFPMVPRWDGLVASSRTSTGEPLDITISDRSDLWPNSNEERELKFLLTSTGLRIDINRSPVALDKLPQTHGAPDFNAFALFPSNPPLMYYDLKTEKLRFSYQATFEKNGWSATGNLTSFLDLPGSQIIFTIPISKFAFPVKIELLTDNTKIFDIANHMHPSWINIDFGEGRSLTLGGDKLKKTLNSWGQPTFTINLPTSLEEVRKLGGTPRR